MTRTTELTTTDSCIKIGVPLHEKINPNEDGFYDAINKEINTPGWDANEFWQTAAFEGVVIFEVDGLPSREALAEIERKVSKFAWPPLPAWAKYSDGDYQRKVTEFVGREVHYCASYLISHLAEVEPDNEDIYNLCSIPQYTHTFEYECGCDHCWNIEDNEPTTERLDDYTDIDENEHISNCPECSEPNEATNVTPEDTDHLEVYEHWIVSDWLADKLADKGEVVDKDFHGLTIWGRCATGQAIMLDRVVCDIYDDLHADDTEDA